MATAHRAYVVDEQKDAALDHLQRLAELLDNRYVDPLLGFVLPGVGDALGSLLGLYAVWVALAVRAHPVVVARILLNLAVDALLGAIPLVGVVGDIFFRANLRNVALLRARQAEPVRPVDYVIVVVAVLSFVAALLLPVVVLGWLLVWLFQR